MAVLTVNRPSLQYMDSKIWNVPEQLLVDMDGTLCSNMSPISYCLVNVICDGLQIPKNASLAESPGLEKLKEMRNKKVKKELLCRRKAGPTRKVLSLMMY
jgi:hypothetical protein